MLRFIGAMCLVVVLTTSSLAAKRGVVEVSVVDATSGEPIPARMHLKDQKGKVVKIPGTVHYADHFVIEGKVKLELPTGNYFFELEHGPEYKTLTGNFYLDEDTVDQKIHRLERFIDMAAEGWYSGDPDCQRPESEREIARRAEDLRFVPVPQFSMGPEDREGGGLAFFGLSKSLTVSDGKSEYPSSAHFLRLAREEGAAACVARKATAWDLPLWVALGQIDAVAIGHGELLRAGPAGKESGKPRERLAYGNATGAGRWSQDVYYHLLNCGLRIPPVAGSGCGVVSNPPGYNRVYVHVDRKPSAELDEASWWQSLKAGRVLVTNGPLMTPRYNDQLPGHVFTAEEGKEVSISIALNLATKEKIDYLEIIHNGKPVQEVRLDQWAKNNGVLPPVVCKESGWVLVRAVTNNTTTYRYAMSGPVYVTIGYQPRISRSSARFFYDWVVERAKRIRLTDAAQREEVIAYHRQARDYWQGLLDKANVD